MKSIKTNPNSAKGPDKGKIVNKLHCILLTTKLAESSFLCRFRIESVNVFVLPRFDLCHVAATAFFINKQFRTCANAFPNEFTVKSYEYCTGKHWILYWIQENKTATYFLRSRLFTYDIMKNFNYN